MRQYVRGYLYTTTDGGATWNGVHFRPTTANTTAQNDAAQAEAATAQFVAPIAAIASHLFIMNLGAGTRLRLNRVPSKALEESLAVLGLHQCLYRRSKQDVSRCPVAVPCAVQMQAKNFCLVFKITTVRAHCQQIIDVARPL